MQQQYQTSCDENADSLPTRQRVTSAQIPDVWKHHGAGCSRHCTAINKAACMRRWTNSAAIPLRLKRGWKWTGMRTSEVSYWHNTYKLARSHGVLYRKGINCVVEQQITKGGPPSKCTPRPEGAQAANSCLTHSSVGKQDHICFQHMLWGKTYRPAN